MRNWLGMLLFNFLFLILFSPSYAMNQGIVLTIDGTISPATQDYIVNGLSYANKKQAELVILKINTPGGLESAMRGINEAIIKSHVPVIGFVAPAGARAASAGAFILMATHIAAMAPGTHVGAASPVNLLGNNPSTLTVSEKKSMQDAAAYLRSLAQMRGRNAKWAEEAVLNSVSITAQEAKKLNVINEIAENETELLAKINGKELTVRGIADILHTQQLELAERPATWQYHFLDFITNPNITYLLILIAIYGIFFELANPGLILPGVAGLIALLLVLYTFQLMPVNYVGFTLLLIGIVFMVIEAYVMSYGILGVGGLIAFTIGSIMLFDINSENYQLAWSLIFTMSFITLTFFFSVIYLAFRAQHRVVVTGREALLGKEGTVISVMNEQVIVRVLGEIWEANSNVLLTRGQKIKVTDINGLKLFVVPLHENK